MVASPPRAVLASGAAAAALCGMILAGRLDGSIATVLALSLAARATASAGVGPAGARAMRAAAASVPAWAGVLLVAVIRSGSGSIATVAGANAVAGIPLVRGNALGVAASWLALLAAIGCVTGVRDDLGAGPATLVGAAGAVLQAWLVLALFVGPQVRSAGDIVPWVAGAIAFALVWVRARDLDLSVPPAVAAALAWLGVVLAFGSGRI